jgi:hypothetical protein
MFKFLTFVLLVLFQTQLFAKAVVAPVEPGECPMPVVSTTFQVEPNSVSVGEDEDYDEEEQQETPNTTINVRPSTIN